MKAMRGKVNPGLANQLLVQALEERQQTQTKSRNLEGCDFFDLVH
jgi:hypothetical protein